MSKSTSVPPKKADKEQLNKAYGPIGTPAAPETPAATPAAPETPAATPAEIVSPAANLTGTESPPPGAVDGAPLNYTGELPDLPPIDLSKIQSPPPQPLPSSQATEPPNNSGQGCQCPECLAKIATGGKGERRGRHHKSCPCVFCASKRGEPAQAAQVVPAVPNPFDTSQAPAADVAALDAAQYAKMAALSFDTSTGLLSGILGPEWQPRSKEERETVVVPLAEYYRIKGIKDLSPGWVVAISVMAYSLPRVAHENTKTKLQIIWGKVKIGLARLFKKKG